MSMIRLISPVINIISPNLSSTDIMTALHQLQPIYVQELYLLYLKKKHSLGQTELSSFLGSSDVDPDLDPNFI